MIAHPGKEASNFLEWLWGPYAGGSTARPWHVLEWSRTLDSSMGEAFWKVVTVAWSSFDLIPHGDFSEVFIRFRGSAPRIEKPDRLTVYRGQDAEQSMGLSWTTSKVVAEDFARGHRGKYNLDPIIFLAEVTAAEIAFLCNDREESEIVLFAIPEVVRAEEWMAS